MKKFIMSQWFVDIVAGIFGGGIALWGFIMLGYIR